MRALWNLDYLIQTKGFYLKKKKEKHHFTTVIACQVRPISAQLKLKQNKNLLKHNEFYLISTFLVYCPKYTLLLMKGSSYIIVVEIAINLLA